MRNLTEDELRLCNSDTNALEQYCAGKGFITENFKKRYEGIKIQIGEIEGTKGAAGKSDNKNKTIIIRQDKMEDDKTRRHILYHEIGHFLFGFRNFSNDEQTEVFKKIIRTKESNKQLLTLDGTQYLSGIKLLEEYIAERFAVNATHETLNEDIKIDNNLAYPFSGNYRFDTTFPGAYGVCETLCDQFLGKIYNNFEDVFTSCLDSSFYKDLFEKYDEVEFMQILGEFGYIYESIMEWAKNRTIRSAPQTQEALERLSQMIPKIKAKTADRTNLNEVTPETMAKKTIKSMGENPGKISEGVSSLRGLLARIFNNNKGR